MDQIEILARLEQLLVEWEKQLSQHYGRLEQQIILILQDAYEKGETLAEQQRYNRLEALKKQIDRAVTETYTQVANDASEVQESTFNEVYLLYAYLLHMYFSEEEGELLNVTSAAAKTSALAVIIYLLLKKKKSFLAIFKRDDDSLDVFTKYKNDLVYSIYMDTRDNLRAEMGLPDANKRVKKRTDSAKTRAILALRHYWNVAYNFAQDAVYEAVKEHGGVEKMWISMRDHKVRFAHRELDSTFADENGWFHYQGDRARRPKGFARQELNYNCRCKIFLSFDGKLPKFSRIYDYSDGKYRIKIDERIDELTKSGKTYIQALQQAQKEIKPPRRILDYYITYEDWLSDYGKYE